MVGTPLNTAIVLKPMLPSVMNSLSIDVGMIGMLSSPESDFALTAVLHDHPLGGAGGPDATTQSMACMPLLLYLITGWAL